MMRLLFASLLLVLASACKPGAPEPVLHIDEVARKTPAEVERILGTPTKTDSISMPIAGQKPRYYPVQTYRDGQVHVIYRDGKATIVQVELMKDKETPWAMDDHLLYALGLPDAKPAEVRSGEWKGKRVNTVMRWQNVGGYAHIAATGYPSTGGASVITASTVHPTR